MATLADLNVSIGLTLDDFDKGIKELESGIGRLGSRLQSLGAGLTTYLSAPLALLGGASVKAAADMESLQKGLVSVTGSAEAAERELKALTQVARLPGLGLKEAVQGSINLQAAGFSAEQARDSLQAFGNALATVGKGKADLDGVTLALTQIASKGKISAEEINQISERVPQFRRAIQSAFGTADSEQLQKLGISAQEFVAKTTAELNKLPKATAGLNASFENLGDTIFQQGARIGDAIAKAFRLDENIPKLEAFIQRIGDAFANLSPSIQKTIVIIGAVATAVGPVLLILGKIISLAPLITSGANAIGGALAAITGPVGLVVAAIVAGVALIVSNWDNIVAYFTDGEGGKFLDQIRPYVEDIMKGIGDIVAFAVDVIKTYWEAFKTFVLPVIKETFGGVLPILKDLFSIIGNLFKGISALIRGDWSGLWQALINIAKGAANLIIDLVVRTLTTIPGIIASVIEKIDPASSLAKTLRSTNQAIEDFAGKYKFDLGSILPATTETVDAVSEEYYRLREESENALTTAAAKAKGLTDEQLKALAKVAASLRQVEEENKAFGSSYDYIGERAKALEKGVSTLIDAGFNAQSRAVRKLTAELLVLGQAQKNISGGIGKIGFDSLDFKDQNLFKSIQAPNLKLEVSGAEETVSLFDRVGKSIQNSVQATQGYVKNFTDQLLDSYKVTVDFGRAASGALVDLVSMAGETLGKAISGGYKQDADAARLRIASLKEQIAETQKSGDTSAQAAEKIAGLNKQLAEQQQILKNSENGGIRSFFKGVLSVVANFLGQFGKALIAAGVGALAFKKLLATPGAAIAAGIALTALAGVVSSIASRGPSESSGTSSSGPRTATGFASNAQSGIGGTQQVQQAQQVGINAVSPTGSQKLDVTVNVIGKISGRDIVLLVEQEQKRNERTSG